MKVAYHKETDSMYVVFRGDRPYAESEEVAPGVVMDFDEKGNLLAIEIHSGASEKVDLSLLATEGLPMEARVPTARETTG